MKKVIDYLPSALLVGIAFSLVPLLLLPVGGFGTAMIVALFAVAGACTGIAYKWESFRNPTLQSDLKQLLPHRTARRRAAASAAAGGAGPVSYPTPRYRHNERPLTRTSTETDRLLNEIQHSPYSVLIGRNNCGKSYLLRSLLARIGLTARYLGPSRYQIFNLLNTFTPNPDQIQQRQREHLQFAQQSTNSDNSPSLDLSRSIASMTDERRELLRVLVRELLDQDMCELLTDHENRMSAHYVSVEGHNLSYTSSGFRLVMTLITSLLDDSYEYFLIDEPELGVSPDVQARLAAFLSDTGVRSKYFPHIKGIMVATHSSLFLDLANPHNNYVVSKNGDEITVERIANQADLADVHFSLLGNRFESLFLPSAIVLVEGETDAAFIGHMLSQRFPDFQFSVITGGGDGGLKRTSHILQNLLQTRRSPYSSRIFAVLDSVHDASTVSKLEKAGVPRDRIVVWSGNGIEFVYPPSIMDTLFGSGGELTISGRMVTRNGVSYDKSDLSRRVCQLVRPDTGMAAEFDAFLAAVATAVCA